MPKIQVPRFCLQATESFPGGAPQREEYDSDQRFDFACLDYACEWSKKYECGDAACKNPDCPQHGPAIVASWKHKKRTNL